MLSTKNINLATNTDEIPSSWIFEYYLNLPTTLTGQPVKIKSPLTNEKTPSFKIYYNTERACYMFKDFSSGAQGDGIRLVSTLFNLERNSARVKIINDYNNVTEDLKPSILTEELTKKEGYQVVSYKTRVWIDKDAEFWSSFMISSKLLEEYNIRPIESFIMKKGDFPNITVKGLMYGYFKNDGTLYKIYLPGRKTKFITVCDYLQGSEQLKFEHNILIIASSLKDLLDIKVLFSNVESIAPESENTYISKEVIDYYKSRYKYVFTLFDKDDAGQKAALKYKKEYGIDTIFLNLEKDVSDSIKEHGLKLVRACLAPIIRSLLK